jgi:sulfate adenylyltransferase subunit 2
VKNLDYENKYIAWAEKKYSNITFIQTPHYALPSFIKYGYLGIKKDESMTKTTISKIDSKIRTTENLNWSVYGFKKNDGLTRRLMLNQLPTGINYKTQKAYPLMALSNANVIRYISDNSLIQPFRYANDRPSSGCDISQPLFLSYIKKKYPNDLKKIFEQFPFTEAILFRYEQREAC